MNAPAARCLSLVCTLTAAALVGCAGRSSTHVGTWPTGAGSLGGTTQPSTQPSASTQTASSSTDAARTNASSTTRASSTRNATATPRTTTPDTTNSTQSASAPSIPVHAHAPELGTVPNQLPREVDQSAVFRPTTARAETVEPSTQNISRVTYAEEGADFDPCVSRDGQQLVFASTAHRSTADIYIKRVDSRVVTQLTNDPAHDMMPRFSPDGQSIAFASDRSGNWDIYVMPVTGGRPVQVTFDAADEIAPSWSPDGTQIVYSRMGEMSGRWEMWVANVERPEVANYIGYGLFPQWCPVAATGKDGADRILFQLGRERGRRTFAVWTIDVMDGQAANATEVRSSSKNALVTPSWSPDGEWVVMSEVPLEVGDAESDPLNDVGQPKLKSVPDVSSIWLVSVENEAPVRLTFSNRLALSPVWSKSNRLYFVSNSAGVENIWSMDMQRPLATAKALLPNRSQDTFARQGRSKPGIETSTSDEAMEVASEGEDHR